jgi:A/G-specific adenine glycosylase
MKAGKIAIFFTKELLHWNKILNKREMPWKFEKDPYKIWLSEIILQQTRVEQGMAYYNNFIKKYPTVKKLASAPPEDVFKLWEGLGYYSRCKNLIDSANFISKELKGLFPSTYEGILQLKGVGPYTAAAISSFAFNLPHAVVDGNVMRVLSRYFAIKTPIDSPAGKKEFSILANTLLDKSVPASFNQAIMDFGATVCKPQSPLCEQCPLSVECKAYINGAVTSFPVKEKKAGKKNRWFYYFLVSYDGKYYIKKRTGKDIWQNLHEFILIECNKHLDLKNLTRSAPYKKIFQGKAAITEVSEMYIQQLTHQTIHGCFIRVNLEKPMQQEGYIAVGKAGLKKLAFPRLITRYLSEMQGRF